MVKPILITVQGPTAIGKTELAIKLAQHYNTEIISADSRQFYKEMSIGTAVPSEDELKAVKHHCVQHKSIHETYTVGDFEKEAITILQQLFLKNNVAILVGGSGLYVDAVTKGLDSFPEVPEHIRQTLITEFKANGLPFLQTELKKIDPEYYKKVDRNNPQRLMRAIEVYRASGAPFSSFLNKPKPPRPFNVISVALTAERELIYNRINKRVDKMIAAGLLDEAKRLYEHKNVNALQTVGYQELFSYFDENCSLEEAIEEIKKNTRRFAKRQLTWLRKKEDIIWINWQYSFNEVVQKIENAKTKKSD